VATTTSFAQVFRKRSVAERRFSVTTQQVPRITSAGSSSAVVDRDRNLIRNVTAASVTDIRVRAELRIPGYFQPMTFSSSTPSIATANAGDPLESLYTYQSSGTLRGTVVSQDGETEVFSATTASQSSSTVDVFDGWVAGSLAGHCTDQVLARSSLLANQGAKNVYTTQGTTSGYVRNPGCWLSDIDLSCASPWNSTGGYQRAGTLVSPRHVVFAAHFPVSAGTQIAFVSPAGVAHVRQVTSVLTHPEYQGVEGGITSAFYPDIQIGVLDSDLTEQDHGVRFARVLPLTWPSKMTFIRTASPIPAVTFNRLEQAGAAELRALGNLDMFPTGGPDGSPGRFGLQFPTAVALQPGYNTMVQGDSGNPVFIVVNGEPVLIGTFTSGGAGGGTFLTAHTEAVNTMMSTLGGGYQLTPIDLSAFPTY
jgi:hypothetical protein